MTDRDDDDELTAAEYALGTLDPEERTAAAQRRVADSAFDGLIAAWERRLTALSDASPEVAPPADAWSGILRRLGLAQGGTGATVLALSRSVRRWQRATGLVTALAACLALVIAAGAWRGLQPPAPTFVALLQKTDAAPAYVMKADLRDRTVAVRALDAKAPEGRAYELWIIDPQIGAPKSLGVLDPSTSTHALPAGSGPDVLARATYAVTEEKAGGSPTGAPTSAPIYLGHLVSSSF